MDVSELRITLTVDDFEGAVAFYRDALGLPEIADWSGEDGKVVLLDASRATLEIFDEAHAEMIDRVEVGRRVSGSVRLCAHVADSGATAERLAAAGGELEAEPVDTPWGERNARIQTPDGLQLT